MEEFDYTEIDSVLDNIKEIVRKKDNSALEQCLNILSEKSYPLDGVTKRIFNDYLTSCCDQQNIEGARLFINYLTEKFFQENDTDKDLFFTKPLITSVNKNSLETVKLLVEKGINLNGMHKTHLLSIATATGNMDLLQYLVENGASLVSINQALLIASTHNQLKQLTYLNSIRCEERRITNSELLNNALNENVGERNNLEVITYLLEHTPVKIVPQHFLSAIHKEKTEPIELLMKHKNNPGITYNYLYQKAAEMNKESLLKWIHTKILGENLSKKEDGISKKNKL